MFSPTRMTELGKITGQNFLMIYCTRVLLVSSGLAQRCGRMMCCFCIKIKLVLFSIIQCLSAGTNIVDRVAESENIRPLAKKLTSQIDALREHLKEQSLRNPYTYGDKVHCWLFLPSTQRNFLLAPEGSVYIRWTVFRIWVAVGIGISPRNLQPNSKCLFYSYVSIMVPVKTSREYDLLQDVCVLFSETLSRCHQ